MLVIQTTAISPSSEWLMADRRPIVANYLATNRKPKSVANFFANFLFADLRFRAALVAVLPREIEFPEGEFWFSSPV